MHDAIAALPTEAYQAEARVPLALGLILPAGILGMFVAAMYGAYLSTDDTYLHSWATIFVQDVVLPIRQALGFAPVGTGTHLWLVKCAVMAIALFAFPAATVVAAVIATVVAVAAVVATIVIAAVVVATVVPVVALVAGGRSAGRAGGDPHDA